MRRSNRILSLLLVACMVLGMIPLLAFAGVAAAVDYDTAEDGDLIYKVNFNELKVLSQSNDTKGDKIAISEDGNKLSFVNQSAAASYILYGMEDMQITGHVYTLSYYTEVPTLDHRVSVPVLHDGNSRIGLWTIKGNTDRLQIIRDGTALRYAPNLVSRKNDTENHNRQYYKVVVDGINMAVRFYALDTNDTYSLIGNIAIEATKTTYKNFLVIGMYAWEATTAEAPISLGGVTVHKGSTLEKTAYQTKYDAANNGDSLYDVDFSANNADGFAWGDYRPSAYNTISEDGNTLTLNHTANATMIYASYLPDASALSYGSFTYEFFINSGTEDAKVRTGLSVIGCGRQTTLNNYISAGFTYFNGATRFVYNANFINGASTNATNTKYLTQDTFTYKDSNNKDVSTTGIYLVLDTLDTTTEPDTSDATKPNVKIEFDTLTNTITNYVLSNGEFVAVARITMRSRSILAPMIYLHSYDAGTNAQLSNMKIVKGLSVTKEEPKMLDLVIDGKAVRTQLVSATTKLPGITIPSQYDADYYTAAYQTADGKLVSTIDELNLSAGYNCVELKTVYLPKAVENNIEIRGVQTTGVAEGANTTSVRFVAVVDSLEFEKIEAIIFAVYKDANGNVKEAKNEIVLSTSTVYTSIQAAGETVTAEQLGGKYICVFRINNVPAGENVQVDFYVDLCAYEEGADNSVPDQSCGPFSIVNGEYKIVEPLG